MLGKIDGERRSRSEDEMVRQPHQLNGHEFEQIPGDRGGQRSLACCSPWCHRVRYDLVAEQQQIEKGLRAYNPNQFLLRQ